MKHMDIVGKTINGYTVIEYAGVAGGRHTYIVSLNGRIYKRRRGVILNRKPDPKPKEQSRGNLKGYETEVAKRLRSKW